MSDKSKKKENDSLELYSAESRLEELNPGDTMEACDKAANR
jgi:hypothetical protein